MCFTDKEAEEVIKQEKKRSMRNQEFNNNN